MDTPIRSSGAHGSGEETAAMIEKAIELGFTHYSITEHAPVPEGVFESHELAAEFNLLPAELDAYFQHVGELKKSYANKITILTGLEIDFIAGYEESFDRFIESCASQLDDLLVSVHMMQGKSGLAPLDFTPELFASELIAYYGDVEQVHYAYWKTVEQMVHHPIPSQAQKRIGHLGLINKFIKRFPVSSQTDSSAFPLDRLFAAVKNKGWDIDYNVAGLKKELCHQLYISDSMMEFCRKYDIRLIYGSDAHDVESVGQFYHLYQSTIEKINSST